MKSNTAAGPFRYRLTVSYDGSAYAGWQVQPNHVTVQQRIEEVIFKLTGVVVKVHGSGRTDQGVHARGQVAHLELTKLWRADHLRKGMNALLPADIRVIRAGRVKADFHARRSAIKKEYRYFIWNDEVMHPYQRLYATHIRKHLDVTAMRAAAGALVGRHDFGAFTANSNQELESTVRELYYLKIRKTGAMLTVIVASEGFLYKMVRSICGMLIRVGEGGLHADEVRHILKSKIRTARVPTAPPEGLFLWKVWY
jgi:tRNA pseudouridine38-40 synthase